MPRVTREYHIDLSLPAHRRWAKMMRSERSNARALVRTCISEAKFRMEHSSFWEKLFGPFFGPSRSVVSMIYKLVAGDHEYREDMEVWARSARVDPAELIFANLSYELTQGFGCTAVAFNLPGGRGLGHTRNMDWCMSKIGPLTCLIHFEGPAGPFTSVGWPGFVGVLSGVAPGRFSASINQVPQRRHWLLRKLPFLLGWPASFALRYNFERSASVSDVVEDLCDTVLVSSALFLVVGTERGDAVVVEHSGPKAACRRMRNGVLSVANHYERRDFLPINKHWDRESLADSRNRRRHATAQGKKGARRARTANQAISLLDGWPTRWEMTAQQMAFIPSSGKYAVRYRDTDRAVEEELRELEEGG